MKTITKHAKFLLFTFTFLLFSLNANAQTCSPAPIGLVSWWQAENNSLDSRSRNNGTLLNGTTFGVGNIGQAFNFDGVNDSVQVPDNANQNINGSFSAETWIFPRSVSNNSPRILEKSDGSNRWVLSINQSSPANALGLIINPSQVTLFSPANSIVLNQWSHIAFTYNSINNEVKLFINGAQVASTSTTAITTTSTNPLVIGNDFLTGTRPFDGLIDEPSIYNAALSGNQIQAIFNSGTAGKCKPTATVSPSGQVGWWSGDGNANDIAGGNNGTLQNGAIHTIGKVGQSLTFDGENAVLATQNSTLNTAFPTISIEGWVNPTAHGTDSSGTFGKTIVSNTNGDGFALRLLNGVIQSDLRLTEGDARTTFGTVLPLNSWSHVALTYDGANVKAFLNGVQVGSNLPASGTVKNTANSGICLFIGGDPSPACTTDTGFGFKGGIDELSIYNRAITQDEITSIFNAGIAGKLKQNATINLSSVISLWQGEGNTNDTRGVNNGTFASNTYATGKVGQGFSVNGISDTVVTTVSAQSTPVFTLEAWVKQLSAVNDSINQELIVGDGVASIVVRKIGGVDKPVFQYRDSTGNTFQQVIGTTGIPLNTFTHFAGTYDGATLRLYVNGVLDNQSTPTNLTVSSCISPYFIGGFFSNDLCGSTDVNFQFLNGIIDESAHYNRALSSTEVRANYEAGNALSTVVGDARVTFPTVSTAGITNQIPIELSTLPSLPSGSTTTGLTYDIATTADFTGSPQVCFNLPFITDSTAFNNLRILHLENGAWINRTNLLNLNFATRTICTNSGLNSLSPFAIVNGFAPTAAEASISGRVTTASGRGIRNAVVQISGGNLGETKYVRTNPFGYYRISGLDSGQTYILNVASKQYSFVNPTRVITLNEDLTGEDFVSDSIK